MSKRPLVLSNGSLSELTDSEILFARKILSQEKFEQVYNSTGDTIDAFKIVKAIGDYSSGSAFEISVVSALTDIPLGITTAAINNAFLGNVLSKGILNVTGFNTTSATPGTSKVYCDASGNLTLTQTDLAIGIVLTASANGTIFVNIGNMIFASGGGSSLGIYEYDYNSDGETLISNSFNFLNDTIGFGLNLPSTPSVGDVLYVVDTSGVRSVAYQEVLLNRNGNLVNGNADDIKFDLDRDILTFIFSSSGWVVF